MISSAQSAGFEPHHLLLVLALLLITASIFSMWKKRNAQRSKRVTGREQLQQLREKERVRGDLESLMVEVEQLARQMSSQLDAKSHQLEALIDEADRRIADLRQLEDERTPSRQAPDVAEQRVEETAPPTAPPPTVSTPSASPSSESGVHDALPHRVYELADRGLAAEQIADQLDEHAGKVELILALRNTGKT